MLTPTGVTASAYWDAIKAGNIQHIRMTFTDGTVLDEQDVLFGGITIHDIMNGDTDLTFGKAVMKQLNVNFINSDRISAVQWASEFTLEIGVEIGGATNWVTVGVFRGERPDKIHYVDVIQFTAYDRMKMFETPADAFLNGLAYPKTFAQILSALCDYVGVSYVAGDELTNIKSRSFNAGFMSSDVITCRDLLAVMAEACGCYAKITATGGMRMTWFSSASHSVVADEEFQVEAFDIDDGMTWDEAEQYTWNEAEGFTWNDFGGYEEIFGVNGLVVKLTENDVGVSYGDTAGNVYLIVDNPFLVIDQDSDKATYIQPIYNRLTAFGGYLPIRVECVGNWLIESGDVIIADVHGSNMSLPVFTNDLVWNGSCINTFESTGSKHREVVSSSNRMKLTNGGKYHELIVDIDQLHSEIGDRTGSSTTITQDIQNVNAVATRKSSVWTSRSDPALTEPVQESDIWIRKRFKTWNEVKDYYATWNAVKADNDEWNSLFIEDMYYRRNGVWAKNYDAVGEFDTLNNKYTIRSGIHIEPEGVEIDAGKYLKIKSGGTFDVDSNNFKISSQEKKLVSGNWQFDDEGMIYKKPSEDIGFEVAEISERDNDKTGIYYQYVESGGYKIGDMHIIPVTKDSNNVTKKGQVTFRVAYNEKYQSIVAYILPDPTMETLLGETQAGGLKFYYARIGQVDTQIISVDDSSAISAVGSYNRPFGHYYGDKIYTGQNKDGEIGLSSKPFKDAYITNVHGAFYYETSPQVQNCNNAKTPGHYVVPTIATNRPTGLAIAAPLDVIAVGTDYIIQRIFTASAIFSRTYTVSLGQWTGWFKFTGTAV